MWTSSSTQASCNPLNPFRFSAPSDPSFRTPQSCNALFRLDDRPVRLFALEAPSQKINLGNYDKLRVVVIINNYQSSIINHLSLPIINVAFRQWNTRLQLENERGEKTIANAKCIPRRKPVCGVLCSNMYMGKTCA